MKMWRDHSQQKSNISTRRHHQHTSHRFYRLSLSSHNVAPLRAYTIIYSAWDVTNSSTLWMYWISGATKPGKSLMCCTLLLGIFFTQQLVLCKCLPVLFSLPKYCYLLPFFLVVFSLTWLLIVGILPYSDIVLLLFLARFWSSSK